MKKAIIMAGSMLLVQSAWAAQPTYYPEEIADRVLKVKDYDHNGSIDRAEYERADMHQFEKIDTNHDQVISAEEMFVHRYAGRPEMKIKTPRVREQIVKNMMKRLDRNHDMQISLDEKLHRVRSEFSLIDRNQNEVISRDELVSHWQRKKNEMERARNQNKDDD